MSEMVDVLIAIGVWLTNALLIGWCVVLWRHVRRMEP